MNISGELRGFIEHSFEKMLQGEPELKKKRREYRLDFGKRDKAAKRKAQKDLCDLKKVKDQGLITERSYEAGKTKAEAKAQDSKARLDREAKWKGNPYKGKEKLDLNIFGCMAYHLIKKATNAVDEHIYAWIADFLNGKGYKKSNGKGYKKNDILQIVYKHHETETFEIVYKGQKRHVLMQDYFESLYEHIYENHLPS